jgi:hypothetical protein
MTPLDPVAERSANPDISTLSLEEAAERIDVGAQPGPEDLDITSPEALAESASINLSQVTWPSDDRNAPDYAYVAEEPDPGRFVLTPDTIEALLKLNRYAPVRSHETIAFALRGATLLAGHDIEDADVVELNSVRPDHRNFRCVLGFYFTGTRKLSVFTGSTVPCRRAVWGFANGGDPANMLPTGLHTLYVWRHKALRPALRMGLSSADPETGARATVLRTRNDVTFGTQDPFDLSVPLDNIHCSYFTSENSFCGASFSSWGCLTVRGEKTPGQQWKKFQKTLTDLGARTRVDLLLATGKDVALIDAGQGDLASLERKMGALRRGSQGPEVKRLQEKIGLTGSDIDGDFGPATLDRFVQIQRQVNQDLELGPIADGIYSHAMEAKTGWGVFGSA